MLQTYGIQFHKYYNGFFILSCGSDTAGGEPTFVTVGHLATVISRFILRDLYHKTDIFQ